MAKFLNKKEEGVDCLLSNLQTSNDTIWEVSWDTFYQLRWVCVYAVNFIRGRGTPCIWLNNWIRDLSLSAVYLSYIFSIWAIFNVEHWDNSIFFISNRNDLVYWLSLIKNKKGETRQRRIFVKGKKGRGRAGVMENFYRNLEN